jgi:hypothetical protein
MLQPDCSARPTGSAARVVALAPCARFEKAEFFSTFMEARPTVIILDHALTAELRQDASRTDLGYRWGIDTADLRSLAPSDSSR